MPSCHRFSDQIYTSKKLVRHERYLIRTFPCMSQHKNDAQTKFTRPVLHWSKIERFFNIYMISTRWLLMVLRAQMHGASCPCSLNAPSASQKYLTTIYRIHGTNTDSPCTSCIMFTSLNCTVYFTVTTSLHL